MLKTLFRLFFSAPRRRNNRPAPPRRIPPVTAKPVTPRKEIKPSLTPSQRPQQASIKGRCYVIDGDTIVIAKQHIRLFGIDAPEMDQPYGKKSKSAMITLCKGHSITAEVLPESSYDRVVAKCYLPDGTDLSAALVEQGLALDWAKFSNGAYRNLEPEGVRKRLWRVAAKHEGRYFNRTG